MSPEDIAILEALQPSDEDLERHLEAVRHWEHNILPAMAFGRCDIAWPRVRERALSEWRQQLAHPGGEGADSMLPVVGWYLAAVHRDADFLPALLEGWRLDGDARDLLFGDVLTNDGSSLMALMASRSAGAIDLLEAAALPQTGMDPLYNALPLEALAVLVADGVIERARFDGLVRRCINVLSSSDFSDDADTAERRTWLAASLCDLGVGDFAEELRAWFDQHLMDEGPLPIIDREWLEEAIARGPDTQMEKWRDKVMYDSIPGSPYQAMAWMMGGGDDLEEDDDDLFDEDIDDDALEALMNNPDIQALLPLRAEPKIGRNEPCPCGSGKKYKKCCGAVA